MGQAGQTKREHGTVVAEVLVEEVEVQQRVVMAVMVAHTEAEAEAEVAV